ncbi:MAG: ATP-dependent DNA helicase RecG [Lachnospiraceae bacterium]|nr:ATP-dependent DNA helicase RecG [Lachnospiraceae bacterium]
MELNSPIRALKGIGEKTEQLFHKIGVYTIRDILLYYPRDYVKFPAAKDVNEVTLGETAAVFVRLKRAPLVKKTRRMMVTTAFAEAGVVRMQFVWFRMPYIKNMLTPGSVFVLYGKVITKNNILTMEQPKIYTLEQYRSLENQLLPIYSLSFGLTNHAVKKAVTQALEEKQLFSEYLPAEIRKKYDFIPYEEALRQIHFPDSMENLITARRRLVFDEFFFFLLNMRIQKEITQKEKNPFTFLDDSFVKDLTKKLPYPLTNAQKNTLEEIQTDLFSPYVMQRLIQGDVGSGKTIVAFLAMAEVSHSGYQSAIMAPTEVLARQHYETFKENCERFGLSIPIILLTGSLTAKQKREAYEKIALYKNAMIIGTNALIQEKVIYQNLALVITDEQHRFGVKQREAFSEKGIHPHILVMSATPIPRTLALILYGDLDISVMNEVPAKRLPIKNCVVSTAYRPKAYNFIQNEVAKNHQAYIICPLVESSENLDCENVVDYTEKLKNELDERIQVACLHGKMKAEEKNKLMEQFLNNEIQVLVSTTVIEVGVNVPNATVMMIENAERFGLAQLHQLRGRVGRGDAQSYCIMINGSNSKQAEKRLSILNHSNDGFFIASEDLKLRGPGDFFGIRQSGDMQFKLGDIYQDADLLQKASELCDELLEEDAAFSSEKNAGLKKRLESYQKEQFQKLNL